jgi:hypothetical protein
MIRPVARFMHPAWLGAALGLLGTACASGGEATTPATDSNTIDPTTTGGGGGSQGGQGQGGNDTTTTSAGGGGTTSTTTTTSAGGSGQGGQAQGGQGQGGQQNTGCVDNTSCDDGDSCTMDTCSSGVCQHQGLPTDDGSACTVDGCDPKTGVFHKPIATDDGDACTVDLCDPVKGVVHTAVNTDDGNACTADACDPKSGVTHSLVATDDGDACTIDACDPVKGVSHTAVSTDDGNACTIDSCDPKGGGVSHALVPTDDQNVCTIDACDPKTGVSHTPIAVDDGNACTADACDPKGGVTHVAVSSDDGDPCTVDSCDPKSGPTHSPLCGVGQVCNAGVCSNVGGTPKVYLASANGTAGFYAYDVQKNTWATLASPPSVTYSQLTTDGTNVYEMGSDNNVYKFTPGAGTWTKVQAGPGAETASPIGFFKYANGTFYYVKDGGSSLRWSTGGAWSTVSLSTSASSAGSYDAATGNLYIRSYGNLGVMVFSTASKSVTKTWSNPTSTWENGRTGSYYGGFFYARGGAQGDAAFTKIDMGTGAATLTAIKPTEYHTSTDVNPATGDIYVGPYQPSGLTFQVYKTASNTLSSLASLPAAVSNHSTVVFVSGGAQKQKVGQYSVSDGPAWGSNPPTYTCLEACAKIFGGNAAEYACSTQANVIDNKANTSIWGISNCQIAAENFKINTFYDCGASNCSQSAYVSDNCSNGTNYCWK